MEVAGCLHCAPLPSVRRTLLIFFQSWRQLFNKAGMSPALSALFSFCRAAGEVMCASQIFMEDPRSSLSHSSSERERERDGVSKCRTYKNNATDFHLHDHIRLSGGEWRLMKGWYVCCCWNCNMQNIHFMSHDATVQGNHRLSFIHLFSKPFVGGSVMLVKGWAEKHKHNLSLQLSPNL